MRANCRGFLVGTSWNRKYADTALKPILGTVTTQKQGIPEDMLDEYLKEGFQRNDRVGTAFLEKGYEKYLQGTHTISNVLTDKQGNVTGTEVKQKGSKGDNLKLTIDLKFQDAVDKDFGNRNEQYDRGWFWDLFAGRICCCVGL